MSYRDEVLADNPVSYWRLGESSGTTAVDEKAANNATYEGGVTLGAAGLLTSDTNTAVDLDGVDDRINCGTSSTLNPATEITVECWMKVPAGNTDYLVSRDRFPSGFGDSSYVLFLRGVGDGRIGWATNKTGPNEFITVNSPLAYNDNVRHHVVGRLRDSDDRWSLFVDGSEVVFGTWANGLISLPTTKTVIGWTDGQDVGTSLDGVIDEVAIYNTALSDARIAAHYTAGTTSQPENLTAGSVDISGTVTTQVSTDASTSGSVDISGTITTQVGTPVSTDGTVDISGTVTTVVTTNIATDGSVDISGTVTTEVGTSVVMTGSVDISGTVTAVAGPPPGGPAAVSGGLIKGISFIRGSLGRIVR